MLSLSNTALPSSGGAMVHQKSPTLCGPCYGPGVAVRSVAYAMRQQHSPAPCSVLYHSSTAPPSWPMFHRVQRVLLWHSTCCRERGRAADAWHRQLHDAAQKPGGSTYVSVNSCFHSLPVMGARRAQTLNGLLVVGETERNRLLCITLCAAKQYHEPVSSSDSHARKICGSGMCLAMGAGGGWV